MILTVPVKGYVRAFLLSEFGREPIRIRANSDLGTILLLAFQRSGERVDLEQVDLVEGEDGLPTASLKFELGSTFERGFALGPDLLPQLTSALTAYFRQSMYYFSEGRRTLFNSEMASVRLFLAIKKIDEELLTEETAVKMAQRERRERYDFRQNRQKRLKIA